MYVFIHVCLYYMYVHVCMYIRTCKFSYQEHEKRVKEEKRKQELEQQKKKLQNVDISKPQVDFDDIFKKQIPVVQKPPPSDSQTQTQNKTVTVSHDTSSPAGSLPVAEGGSGRHSQVVETGPISPGDADQSRGERGGSDEGTCVATEPKPSTGTYVYTVCIFVSYNLINRF